jgi:flagellar protein FliO/FliZ
MLMPIPTAFGGAVVALAAVLALIWLTQRILRAGGLAPRSSSGRLALVSMIALDPRRKIALVRCDNRYLLLLTGGANDLLLGWIPDAPAGIDTASRGPVEP